MYYYGVCASERKDHWKPAIILLLLLFIRINLPAVITVPMREWKFDEGIEVFTLISCYIPDNIRLVLAAEQNDRIGFFLSLSRSDELSNKYTARSLHAAVWM